MGDIALAREVNTVFGEVFQEPEEYTDNPPPDEWLANLLGNPGIYVIAAIFSRRVVGAIVCYEFDKLERAVREVYVYDIGVLSGYQRRGVATALMDKARRIAATRNVSVLYVQAMQNNTDAIAFHSSVGTQKAIASFDIEPLAGG